MNNPLEWHFRLNLNLYCGFDVAICKQQYNDDNSHVVNKWDRFEEYVVFLSNI